MWEFFQKLRTKYYSRLLSIAVFCNKVYRPHKIKWKSKPAYCILKIYGSTVKQIYEITVTQICPSSPLPLPCVIRTDHDSRYTWPASQPVSIPIFLHLPCHVLGLTSGISSTDLQTVLWVPWKATLYRDLLISLGSQMESESNYRN